MLPFLRLHINHEKEQCPAQTHGAQPQVPSHVRSSRQLVPRDARDRAGVSGQNGEYISRPKQPAHPSKRCAFYLDHSVLQSV
jgi:hypothetical protein